MNKVTSNFYLPGKNYKTGILLGLQDCNNQTERWCNILANILDYFCNFKSDSKSFFKKLSTLCVASEAYNRNIQFDHPDDMLNRPLSQRGETVYEEAFLFWCHFTRFFPNFYNIEWMSWEKFREKASAWKKNVPSKSISYHFLPFAPTSHIYATRCGIYYVCKLCRAGLRETIWSKCENRHLVSQWGSTFTLQWWWYQL